MTPASVAQIAAWMNARAVGEAPEAVASGICTDSRSARAGDLFFALQGENADGHVYVSRALEPGVAAAVVSQQWFDQARPQSGTYIVCPDPLAALGKWAQVWRKNFDIPVVAITGSAGKTTTREMIAAALFLKLRPLVSRANFNTEIGVPQTLLDLTAKHKAAVIEMAMRGQGQISYLCQIALPSAAVITNIGQSHLELLGSRQNIAYAKAELLESLPTGAWSVLPADDDFYEFLVDRAPGPVISFGLSPEADYRASDLMVRQDGCVSFRLNNAGGYAVVDLRVPGRFHVANACAAVAVAVRFGLSLHEIADALSRYAGFDKRSKLVASRRGWTVYDDTYNASPAAAAGAVEALCAMATSGRRIAVLGDMLELGEAEAEAHRELGCIVACCDPQMLVTVGTVSSLIYQAAQESGYGGPHEHFETSSEAAAYLEQALQEDDIVLIKGSRLLAMEAIVERLIG